LRGSRYFGYLLVDIGEIFRTHTVLITGANGFLGKVILGLLLDRYPGVRHVYVLLRARWRPSAAARFEQETLSSPALASLAARLGPSVWREKVTVLEGDVGEPECGLAAGDLGQLTGRVDVFINCAGLVDFFPPVDESFRSNVDGVQHVLALARKLGAKIMHISTCYVSGQGDGLVEETVPILGFYPRRTGPEDTSFRHEDEIAYTNERARLIRKSSGGDGKGKELARRLTDLGRQRAEQWGWVNTYTYAKSLGEQILAAQTEVAHCIVRPAIIESALRFPFPGWIEGGRTSAPLVLMARGGMKDWPVRPDAPLEIVPVDLVAAATLVVTALLLEGRHEPVYQLGTADVNPLPLGPLVNLLAGEARFVSSEEAKARREQLQKRLGQAQAVLGGVKKALENAGVPAGGPLNDWAVSLRTKGLQATLREQTIHQYLPFILHNRYIFESENIRGAYRQLTEHDRHLLPWDPESIDWERYWREHQVKGIEKWVQPEAVKDWAFKI
jgi:long-chain acyl-CoA synthetase